MSDTPNNYDDPKLKDLHQKIETLKRQDASEKLVRSNLAKPEGQPLGPQPVETSDQAALKKLVTDKTYDASTQARHILS